MINGQIFGLDYQEFWVAISLIVFLCYVCLMVVLIGILDALREGVKLLKNVRYLYITPLSDDEDYDEDIFDREARQ